MHWLGPSSLGSLERVPFGKCSGPRTHASFVFSTALNQGRGHEKPHSSGSGRSFTWLTSSGDRPAPHMALHRMRAKRPELGAAVGTTRAIVPRGCPSLRCPFLSLLFLFPRNPVCLLCPPFFTPHCHQKGNKRSSRGSGTAIRPDTFLPPSLPMFLASLGIGVITYILFLLPIYFLLSLLQD